MNEDQPPFPPSKPAQIHPLSEPPPSSPHFGLMFLLGIVLIFLSWGLCYLMQNPMPFLFIGMGAFCTLFFKGYRGIFVGFITTVGVILLGAIIYCANQPFNMH